MEIHILRLGHRLPRDERISTHVALVARAFGANSIVYTGQHDSGLEQSVKRICERWGGAAGGGPFTIGYGKSYRSIIRKYKKDGFKVLHLTMYGIPLRKAIAKLKTKEKILVVVGSEQVPSEVYELADYNISVTSQPHSEVAALAIALDRLQKGKELEFKGKVKIIPSPRGKRVVKSGGS
jgi:tRNA (cytidine56-2'-O)-methyltransferase